MVGDCAGGRGGEGGRGRGQLHGQIGADHSSTQQAFHQIDCIHRATPAKTEMRLALFCCIDTTFEH